MAHTIQVINVQNLADGLIAVTLRCCGDPTTDSVHTYQVTSDHTETDLQGWLNDRHLQVQGLHENRQKAESFFGKLKVSE